MKKLVYGLGLLLALALPAKSEVFFVQIASTTSSAVVNATSTARGGEPLSEPVKFYSLQVRGSTGTVTAWDVRLEISIDGVNFSPVVSHQTTDGNGAIKTSTSAPYGFPATFMRIRTNSIDTSTVKSLVINAIGTQ